MATDASLPLSDPREQIAAQPGKGALRRGVVRALPLALLVLAAGCVTTEGFTQGDKPPPPGIPCQVVTTWQKNVAYAADPCHGGAMAPGLAGRMYLFGPKVDFPMTGDGSLVVDMCDASGEKPVLVERWEIDPKTLHRLLREDMIGWGYTIFLPSDRWKPEMTKIIMKSCYRPAKGAPLFTQNEVTLASSNGVFREGHKPLSFNPALGPPPSGWGVNGQQPGAPPLGAPPAPGVPGR